MDSDEPMVTFAVTVSRTIHPDGSPGFAVTMSDDEFSFIEVLGMLDAARWRVFNQMTVSFGGEDCSH